MFNADLHHNQYVPREEIDASHAKYHARLTACERCNSRRSHECTVANQLCSVLARPANGVCPLRFWPGDPPRPVVAPTPVISNSRRTPHFPLRVGLLTDVFGMGGVERWWLSLCRHWAAGDKLESGGIGITERGPQYLPLLREALRYGPIFATPERGIPGARVFTNGEAACRALAGQCDILIAWCHDDLKPLIGDFSGPVVLVAHGQGEWSRRLIAGALPWATHFAAVSTAAAEIFPAELRDQVRVIPNGIDFDRTTPTRSRGDIRAEWNVRDDQIAVGYIGRFSPEKNPLAAARAVAALNATEQRAVAVYAHPHFADDAADSTPRDAVREVVGEACRFISPDQVGDVLAGMDCFMLASEQEGGSLALLEAMAAGVPAVVTDVGNIRELEERFGEMFEKVPQRATGSQLAAAVERAIERYDFGRSQRSRSAVWENFSAARMARDWETLLESIME